MTDLDSVGIVPVVVINDPGTGVELAGALAAGGIACAEITLRTPAATAVIERIAATQPDFLVGAGTVLTVDDVDRVADAGAQFIVSPGLDPSVVDRAHSLGLLAVPGVATASEIQLALRLGLDHVKFFPAAQLGGAAAIAALAGPFPQVRFMPSGGVNLENAAEYFDLPSVFAVSGSWMMPREVVAARAWSAVTALSKQAMRAIGTVG